ncbi:MAG TPA: protein phosphatase CheZ [Nitrospiraceae bacterium]|nr:protein phosphatase CheZ [Nitrospiraceae bacterium]
MMTQNGMGSQRPRHQGDDGDDGHVQLYAELGDLARFIDTTMRTLSQFSAPVSSTTEQLPQALTHLTDLRLLTERGTHEVMKQVEAIQENRAKTVAVLEGLVHAVRSDVSAERQVMSIMKALEADDKRLIDIMTALSFQDLVAQRVNKLATIIDEVEHKLLELVVVFGPYQKQASKQDQSKAADMLKQLEAAKSTAINQDLADEILKEFGFN